MCNCQLIFTKTVCLKTEARNVVHKGEKASLDEERIFEEYCSGISWHASEHAAVIRAALSPSYRAVQTSTCKQPAMFLVQWGN